MEKNGVQYTTDVEKAQLFADHFKKAFAREDSAQFDKSSYDTVESWFIEYFQEEPGAETKELDVEEYFRVVFKGKNTAAGYDEIAKFILRKLDDKVHHFIIKIYEYCLNNAYFPMEWKRGILVPIGKVNTDHKRVENYRPITLLSVLGKNLERILKILLQKEIGHIIPCYQFGFREHRSTTHPLAILTSNIQTAKLKGKYSAVLMLDINKAFDSVWHHGVLYKLAKAGCSRYLVTMIKNFISERSIQI